jgi:type IV secretion system protein VirD4
VIPNLLDYPGSAFVLDIKGENYAVTARARRAAGQDVFLIDPFGITGATGHAMSWLDALDPDDPEVVSLSSALADMLVVRAGTENDPHWNDTAREMLRGLLVYVAGLRPERRNMAELRQILTAPEDEMAEVLADMLANPERGQRLVARTAAAHLNRPERERGSVLSTAVRHTAWLDDPRLCAALARSDFSFRDLKRRRMTVYLAIPPDRLRACLGFVRGFIGLALNAISSTPGKPAARVAFFLDEFGQLGRIDALVDNITLLRGYGAQLWLFVQDVSQLKAVYPRWQSFLANTTQQYFGTADYDTAHYISNALGQHTIRFNTTSRSQHSGSRLKSGTFSSAIGEHLQGRSLLTPGRGHAARARPADRHDRRRGALPVATHNDARSDAHSSPISDAR